MAIYAVDFDGTLCENAFPEIGAPLEHRIKAVNRLQAEGHKIVLWTCRNGESLEEAVRWCAEHGLTFDSVNENIKEVQAAWGGDTRKVYCDYYIDDKNLPDYFLDCISHVC